MRRGLGLALLAGFAVVPFAHGQPASTPSFRGPRLEAVTLVVRHRVFLDFSERQRVKLNQDFILGDTDFTGRVVQYVPDFEMDLSTHRISSRTDQPKNPAFKIIVRKNKVPQDTTWAFLNMPPHFGRRSYFAFHVVRIDFAGRAPLLADTTVAAPASPPPPASAASPRPAAPASGDTVKR